MTHPHSGPRFHGEEVAMTLGRVEEVLDEVEDDVERDYSPETRRYIVEVLDDIRRRLGLDPPERD